jgi:alkylation response protein AidB-like acyl-CoA dehydrogenase
MTVNDNRLHSESVAEYDRRLRQWLATEIEPLRGRELSDAERFKVAQQLYDAGLVGATWSAEYGGLGATPAHQTAYNTAVASYSWALPPTTVTVGICAPTIRDFGSEQQKVRHIPRMLRGDELWTQLLSEPGAGSDLASVSTRAEFREDHWLLNGQKVWTSRAAEADYALALVRTNPGARNREGLSMVIVNLKANGVLVRPLREMTGESLFNEVFLDDVRVPLEDLVGDVDDGWNVLRGMLGHERDAIGTGTSGNRMDRKAFEELVAFARSRERIDDPEVREALAEVHIQEVLQDAIGHRIRLASAAGLSMGPVGSLGKMGFAKSARLAGETGVLIAGTTGQAWPTDDQDAAAIVHRLLYFPMTGIAGGTTEIQRNIVGERLLGLPRESSS